jgi:hypothetical protein
MTSRPVEVAALAHVIGVLCDLLTKTPPAEVRGVADAIARAARRLALVPVSHRRRRPR